MTEPKDFLALRDGLPKGQWQAVKNPHGDGDWYVMSKYEYSIAGYVYYEKVAHAIAAIPDMLAEIHRGKLWHDNDQKCIKAVMADADRLRAINAEMLDAIKAYLDWSTGLNNPQGFCEDTQLRPIRERMRAILDHGLPTAADVRGILKETP